VSARAARPLYPNGTTGVKALSARVTMTEHQRIYVKVTLAIDLAPGQGDGADEFVAYVPEADFFASAVKIGLRSAPTAAVY
jgi:hypothetical protein